MNVFSKFTRSRWSYKPVAQDKFDEEAEAEAKAGKRSHEPPRNYPLIIVFGLFIFGALGVAVFESKESWGSSCRNAPTRQEWRSMNLPQQQDYIKAIQCLMNKPSLLESGTFRYDDFVYTHTKEGTTSHYAAAFLAWHRYFIHLYEKALTDECGFQGSLPYWDWTLDWEDLSASPIFTLDAFGGDGDEYGPIIVNEGRCVLEGPFANYTRHWESKKVDDEFQTIVNPHCLSRGFIRGKFQDTLGSRVSPTYIGKVLKSHDYSHFFKLLEVSAHNAVPEFVNGDFLALSAPNDPVFFLHHAQLDRIWWMWQQADPEHRYDEFTGPKEDFRHNQSVNSSLEDILYGGALGDDVRVKDIIRVDTALLCYRY